MKVKFDKKKIEHQAESKRRKECQNFERERNCHMKVEMTEIVFRLT